MLRISPLFSLLSATSLSSLVAAVPRKSCNVRHPIPARMRDFWKIRPNVLVISLVGLFRSDDVDR